MGPWMRAWLVAAMVGAFAAGRAAGAERQVFSLADCIQHALESNAQLRQARLDEEVAGDDVRRARASLLPQLGAGLGASRFFQGPRVTLGDVQVSRDPVTGQTVYEQKTITQPSSKRDSHTLSFSMSQNVYDGGRSWHGYGRAKAERQAASLSAEATELDVVYEVKLRYFVLLQAESLLEVQEGAVAVAQTQVERAEELLALGAAPRADVIKSQVALGKARLALLDARNQVALAKSNLNYVMGREVTASVEVAGEELERPAGEVELGRETAAALRDSPRLKQLTAGVRARELEVKTLVGDQLPSVAASVSYGRNNPDLSRVYSRLDENYQATYRVSLDLNLFDGWQTRASISRARASLAKAEEAKRDEERRMVLELEQAYLNHRVAQDRLVVASEQVRAAEEDLSLAQERYRLGAGTLLEQLSAQTDLTGAKVDRLRAYFDIRLAEAELERLSGRKLGW